jgi:LPXTG-motif cell wall-anchored protein
MAVTPSPKRDFRGAWLSTVWAIDWPSHRDITEEAVKSQKVELRNILTNYEKCNINACYFQVRGMSDAMYDSKYEPWSQYLTGKRGLAPTYDPFQYLIDEAHARGIEVHAWINPYRVTNFQNYKLDESPDTGDNSLSVNYVFAVGVSLIGIILILYRKKKI